MKVSYLNDAFFSRLETLALHLKSDLAGFFGGKHLVKGELGKAFCKPFKFKIVLHLATVFKVVKLALVFY